MHPARVAPDQSSDEPRRSALSDFLDHVIDHEKMGAVVPPNLLRVGYVGSCITIAAALLAVVLSPRGIREGGFFLLLGDQAADLTVAMRALAGPALIFGGLLIGLDYYLSIRPTSEAWRSAITVQAIAGGISGVMSAFLIGLILLNLAIWIVLVVLLFAGISVMLVGALSG
jgi:hypothetical protein